MKILRKIIALSLKKWACYSSNIFAVPWISNAFCLAFADGSFTARTLDTLSLSSVCFEITFPTGLAAKWTFCWLVTSAARFAVKTMHPWNWWARTRTTWILTSELRGSKLVEKHIPVGTTVGRWWIVNFLHCFSFAIWSSQRFLAKFDFSFEEELSAGRRSCENIVTGKRDFPSGAHKRGVYGSVVWVRSCHAYLNKRAG